MKDSKKKESKVSSLLAGIWFAVLLALNYLLELRTFLWLAMILSAALVIIKVFICFSDEKEKYDKISHTLFLGWVLLFLVIAFPAFSHYTYTSGAFMPFWRISLVIGIITGILYGISHRDRVNSTHWIFMFLVSLIVFFVVNIYTSHLNYILDTNEPERRIAVIEDKEHNRHRKSADSYEFQLTLDGETFDLDVPFSEYNKYEVGDTYVFTEYQGAFNEPFFIAED